VRFRRYASAKARHFASFLDIGKAGVSGLRLGLSYGSGFIGTPCRFAVGATRQGVVNNDKSDLSCVAIQN
jgi:hypothetical protein